MYLRLPSLVQPTLLCGTLLKNERSLMVTSNERPGNMDTNAWQPERLETPMLGKINYTLRLYLPVMKEPTGKSGLTKLTHSVTLTPTRIYNHAQIQYTIFYINESD